MSNSFVNLRVLCGSLLVIFSLGILPSIHGQESKGYLGFDRNDYPGDANLIVLRRTFSYIGYWLNDPPGENHNSWTGKRQQLESTGFGFLVLFNGRVYKELKRNPAAIGQQDAQAAIASVRREGFPARTIVFLDIEEGGRMLPEQKAYIYAWVDGVTAAGFRAGVYCSGIPAKEGKSTIVTADDIRASAQGRSIAFWVTNDVCPPSPGCTASNPPPYPSQSGVNFAEIWQFAQSPRRKGFSAACSSYNSDKNCYAPGIGPGSGLHVDLDTASSADPSSGRKR